MKKLNKKGDAVNINVRSWSEGVYEDYLEISKNHKIIYKDLFYNIIYKDLSNEIGLELNYGKINNISIIFLKEFNDKFYSVPDYRNMYLNDYQYEALQFSRYNLLAMFFKLEEINNIKKININDIILNWILTSSFKGYYTNFEDYIFYLIRDIYFIDDEVMNKDIKKSINSILNLKEKKIICIEYLEFEEINVYFNSGIVWKAFLKDKKTNDIYLNTDYDISIKIN